MVKRCFEGSWVLQWLYSWALEYGQAQVLKGKRVHQKIPQKIPELKIHRKKSAILTCWGPSLKYAVLAREGKNVREKTVKLCLLWPFH